MFNRFSYGKIRQLSWALFFIPALLVSDHLAAQQTKLLILGDSLSAAYGLKQEQGWVSLLQNAWQDEGIEVVNASISGETTDGGLARLPRLLEQHSPTHMLIELGGNDGLQGHPVQKMRDNLRKMIALAKAQNVGVLLQEMRIPTNYGRRYNEMFTQSFSKIGEEHDIRVVPFLLEEVALNPELMQRDGIHPNLQAQPIIARFMQTQLEGLMFNHAKSKEQMTH